MAKNKKDFDKAVEKMMSALGISKEEAEDLVKFDMEEIDNEEVSAIESKAKENEPSKKPAKKGDSLAKVKTQKAKKKADEVKDVIIKGIKEYIDANPEIYIEPQELTSTKVTFMGQDGAFYSVAITKHKACPDGYAQGEKGE